MNTTSTLATHPSFADTTVIELATATVWAPVSSPATRPATRPSSPPAAQPVRPLSPFRPVAPAQPAHSAHPAARTRAAALTPGASGLLTLAVASLVVVPMCGMALVLARLAALG